MQEANLQAAVDYLRGQIPGLRAVYLFGSQAGGDARPDSDVDLAVLADHPVAPRHRLELVEYLADLLRRDVDLVDLRQASTVLRMQVIGHGWRLQGELDLELETFEDLVFSDYARLNEERHAILEDIRGRGSIHGR